MKKKILVTIAIALMALVLTFVLTACFHIEVPTYTMEGAFSAAQELGYKGTFDEFKSTITAQIGEDSELTIQGVALVDDELIVTMSDDSTVNFGKLNNGGPSDNENNNNNGGNNNGSDDIPDTGAEDNGPDDNSGDNDDENNENSPSGELGIVDGSVKLTKIGTLDMVAIYDAASETFVFESEIAATDKGGWTLSLQPISDEVNVKINAIVGSSLKVNLAEGINTFTITIESNSGDSKQYGVQITVVSGYNLIVKCYDGDSNTELTSIPADFSGELRFTFAVVGNTGEHGTAAIGLILCYDKSVFEFVENSGKWAEGCLFEDCIDIQFYAPKNIEDDRISNRDVYDGILFHATGNSGNPTHEPEFNIGEVKLKVKAGATLSAESYVFSIEDLDNFQDYNFTEIEISNADDDNHVIFTLGVEA